MNSFVSSVNAKQHVHGQNTGLYAKSLPAMLSHNTSPSTGKEQSFVRPAQEQQLFQKDQSKSDMYTGLLLKGIIPDSTTN